MRLVRRDAQKKINLPVLTRPEHLNWPQSPLKLVDRYKTIRIIGKGQYGTVLLVKDRSTKAKLAVKRYLAKKKEELSVEQELLVFLKIQHSEPQHHPNVVRYISSFCARPNCMDDDNRCLVIEYVKGCSLQDLLESLRIPLLARKARNRILKSAARGLSFLHSKGVAHRDIKPANIVLRKTKRKDVFDAVLVDLGLACFEGLHVGAHAEEQLLAGTIDYMSPEARRPSTRLTMRVWMQSDLYALGIVGRQVNADSAKYTPLLHKSSKKRTLEHLL